MNRILWGLTVTLLSVADSGGDPQRCAEALSKQRATVIVDPFGFRAGELLPDAVRARGELPFLVLSSRQLPSYLFASFDPRGAPVIISDKDLTQTWASIAKVLKERNAILNSVIPGTESGVRIADALSEIGDLPGNNSRLSGARRDKAEMHRVLSTYELASARTVSIRTELELVQWWGREGSSRRRWVIKPRESAGTDRVFVVSNIDESITAFRSILGGTNAFGSTDDVAIVQEFLEGTEYILDTVTTQVFRNDRSESIHLATGAWRYVRRPSAAPGRTPIIEEVDWVSFDELPSGLKSYGFKVLDAVGVRYGPAHLEIMMTSSGPVLVEVASRLPGGLPKIAEMAAGKEFSQLELTLDSYTRSAKIDELAKKFNGGYPTVKSARIVFLSVEAQGKKLAEKIEKLLTQANLVTLKDYRVFGKPGAYLDVTTDVTNALMRVHLVGSEAQIRKDTEALRKLHAKHFFYE